MFTRLTTASVLISAAMLAPAGAQAAANKNAATPVASAASAPTAAAASEAQPPSRPEDRAAYDPSGRRDPFTSLMARGETTMPVGGRPVGIKGLLIGELSVRGVLRSKGKLLAIVQAPDNKTYAVHPGDTLFDGTVKVVANDAVIFLQRVDDPLSPVKQREIRKTLRTSEETR
jgi:Tfp pilus assembly protein PilP